MNIETLDFGELLNQQQPNPQQTTMNENELIQDMLKPEETQPNNVEEVVVEEEKQELYPIGTVVMLRGGQKRLMIVGFDPLNEERTNKAYDYIGCLFPEGILATDKIAMFNHNQIEKVYHEGLFDEEEKEFKERLADFFDSLN